MVKLLVVEDSTQLRELISAYFAKDSAWSVDTAADGYSGLQLVEKNNYDIAILDIMLPGISGFDICKILRKKSNCPIVFLTALGTEENILKGYDLGADEYMVKPFSLKVLYAKCLALLSRSMEDRKDEKSLICGPFRIYPSRMQVMCGEKEVELAPKEYFLLKVLIENQGHVLGRDTLLDMVWGADFEGSDRVVDNHIKKLRQALGSHGNSIKTVIGRGYKIVP